ncbi:hypothetical protein [Allokutzneria sp. NRRL B-24872]|uniref:hypothetical protein n=1 Tax=Allokutzneria sp. NRRL B-24872 TaxID=1137961 RepID=UPI0011774A87|nr:hypothetical protein [Allokutzneria sp. NRRL B-24872]
MKTVRMAGRGLVVALSTAVLLPFVAGTGNAGTAPQTSSVGAHSQGTTTSGTQDARLLRDGRWVHDRWVRDRWHRRPSHGIGIGVGIGLGLRIGLGIGIGVGIGDDGDDD